MQLYVVMQDGAPWVPGSADKNHIRAFESLVSAQRSLAGIMGNTRRYRREMADSLYIGVFDFSAKVVKTIVVHEKDDNDVRGSV